ncbi:MAG: sensor histidine kinase, partial [Solirubrobacteraceae bacterium]
MSRIEHLARTYWFDLLIALLAIVAMLDVVLGRGSSGAPTTTLWFCLPALAILVLPVFARRWFPFAGPAAYFLLAAGISFVDPLLIPYPESLFPFQLAVAFLLGNLRDIRRAGLGLAIVVGATATLVYNIPGHSVDQLVFIPVDFAVSWVAGVAVRARAEQAEVAQTRATQLKADLRARLEELRASRKRIVEASLEARKQLERDLHDGAQQQLVSLSLDLQLLQTRITDTPTLELLDATRAKLTDALAGLRALARGIHPALLTDRGLAPTLEALAQRAPLPVELKVDLPERPPAILESATYFLVSEVLTNVAKYAEANRVRVLVTDADGLLAVEIQDDGIGGADPSRGSGLRGLSDRIAALDGQLRIESPPGEGTRISV